MIFIESVSFPCNFCNFNHAVYRHLNLYIKIAILKVHFVSNDPSWG